MRWSVSPELPIYIHITKSMEKYKESYRIFRFRKFIAVIFDNRQITSISYKGNNSIAVIQTLAVILTIAM